MEGVDQGISPFLGIVHLIGFRGTDNKGGRALQGEYLDLEEVSPL